MRRLVVGGAVAASLAAAAALPVWPALRVTHDEQVLLTLPDDQLTISYVHSIDRLPIEEDLSVREGELVVERTRLRQFGAGMGQIEGEGRGYADGPWWVVDDLDRGIGPELLLRVGALRVDHRLHGAGTEVPLSHCLPGERVSITPTRVSTAYLLRGPHHEHECEPPPAAESETP